MSLALEIHAQSGRAMEMLDVESLILLMLGEGNKTTSLLATGSLEGEILQVTGWLCSALHSTGEGTEPTWQVPKSPA